MSNLNFSNVGTGVGGSNGSSSGTSGGSIGSNGSTGSGGITYLPPSGGSGGGGSGNSSSSGSGGGSSGSNGGTGGGSGASGTTSKGVLSMQSQTALDEISGSLTSIIALMGVLIVIFGIGLAWKYFKRSIKPTRDTEYYRERANYFRELNGYLDRKRRD